MDLTRYAELFRTESRDQLAEANRALLELERGGGDLAPVQALFRAVHTLKGMSASMGYAALAEFAHELESVLDRVRGGDLAVDTELMDALFASLDALEAAVESAEEGAEAPAVVHRASDRLRHVAGGRATAEFSVVTAELAAQLAATPATATPAAVPTVDSGPGVLVRVRQTADTALPGVRAFMVVQKLRALGEVVAVSPSEGELQGATTPQAFAVRVVTDASGPALEAAVRSAGDVDMVEVVAGRGRTRTTGEHALREEPATPRGGSRQVRIEARRLDTMMDLVGELVIAKGRLLRLTAGSRDPQLDEVMQTAARLVQALQVEILTSRMVPVWQVFDRFPRVVRDTARRLGKEVEFVVEGKDIELDRALLDEIGEPVMHLLRNAVDHGLETPAVRVAAGKPARGRLTLSALRDRSAVLVRVSDDGRGIDRDKVVARAVAQGLLDAGTTTVDDEALWRVLAHPGFSTAETVSEVSGRGVGIDVVQAKARQLGGSLELRTEAGKGTSITMRLPATLAIVRAVLARTGDETYALPLTHVEETLPADPGVLAAMQGKEVLVLRESVLPVLRLDAVVGAAPSAPRATQEIVVVSRGGGRAGLVVDELLGQQEIVVKQFEGLRGQLPIFSGATILADGQPALILDVGSLL